MSTRDLIARLERAQDDLAEALQQEQCESLPGLVAAREDDLRLLVSRLSLEDGLSDWARAYLDRDRSLLGALLGQRDAVRDRLAGFSRSMPAHRAYLSDGMAHYRSGMEGASRLS